MSSRQISLLIWEHRDDPTRMMILYEGQTPADESPTTNQYWRPYMSFTAFNPLVTPYPLGTELFRARHSRIYPYELLEILPVLDVFNVEEAGTYFVANRAPLPGLTKLPFRDTNIFVDQAKKILN